jgi:hypothetical protein
LQWSTLILKRIDSYETVSWIAETGNRELARFFDGNLHVVKLDSLIYEETMINNFASELITTLIENGISENEKSIL